MKESFDQVVKMKGQVMNFMYRFRAKSGDWVWLRTTAFAFLNPYTDDMEYVVCTNSTNAKGGGASATASANVVNTSTTAATASSVVPPPQTGPPSSNDNDYRPQNPPSASAAAVNSSGPAGPAGATAPGGLDYSIGRTSANDVYSSHLSAAAAAAAAASASTYSTYDTSPAAAGNYGGASGPGPRAASVGGKTSAGTPTPPQSAWNANVSEGYHYSNLSPSRSPSGYPRTASATTTVSPAATVSSMWQHWQGASADRWF